MRGHAGSPAFFDRKPCAAPDAPEAPETIGGPSRTRTLDPLIKSANQRVQPDHTDALNMQQLELWPEQP